MSGHLFDESASEVTRFVKRRIDDLIDSREPQLLAGIVSDIRVVNGQRGRLAIFKLDDKSATIEATADEATFNAHREWLRDDELVIVMAKAQQDRFSGGGLRLSVQQVWSLSAARCRFGKYLSVQVNGKAPDIERMLREFPAQVQVTEQGEWVRGLPIRIHLLRENASAQIELGEQARFYPSDAALASWMAQAHDGQAQIVYE